MLELGGRCQRGHLMTPHILYVEPDDRKRRCRLCEALASQGAGLRPIWCDPSDADGPLARVRKAALMSKAEMARRVSLSWANYSHLERDTWHACYKLDTIRKIADVLGEAAWAAFGFEPIGPRWRVEHQEVAD